jgi:hypothetical protein
MACGVSLIVGILVKIFDFLLVNCYREDRFFFKLIGMCLVPFDDHKPLVFMEADF